jgi:hypothetical protein
MMIPAITSLFSPVASVKGIGTLLNTISPSKNEVITDSASNPSKMMQSVLQSLSQLPSNSAKLPTQIESEPIQSFIQSLIGALQSQQSNTLDKVMPNSQLSAKDFQGGSQLEQGLQSLIEQIKQSDTKPLSKDFQILEANANQLFSAIGASTGNESLNQFLNTFKQSISGNSSIGNILSTKA